MTEHFLSKDPFGRYAARVYYEWCQAMDEGRAAEEYESRCRALQSGEHDGGEEGPFAAERLALKLRKRLLSAPVRADYPYEEPSDYPSILAARKDAAANGKFKGTLDESLLAERVAGCWTGRIAGCLLGKPLEFMRRAQVAGMLRATNNCPAARYTASSEFTPAMMREWNLRTGVPEQPWIDEIGDGAPVDDDTNYTVFNLKLLETFGRDFQPNDVLYAWINWMPAGITATAERVAYGNACRGVLAPHSATHLNPYREWVGAQIRAEVFGMVNPGDPAAAAEMAFRDACVSHVRNGVYGELFVAAMVAAALSSADAREAVRAGLREIPARSRLYEAVSEVLGWHGEGRPFSFAADQIHARYDEGNLHHWCHTVPNAMLVAAALLYGAGDFTKTLGFAVSDGFDTDSNGAVAGAIAGAIAGRSGIPAHWKEAFHGKLYSSVAGFECMAVEELARRTLLVQRGEIELDERVRHRYDYRESFTE